MFIIILIVGFISDIGKPLDFIVPIAYLVLSMVISLVVWRFFAKIYNCDVLVRKIVKDLDEKGFKCKMDEGNLIYTMNDRKYHAGFWQTKSGLFRVSVVDYAIIDEKWDDISTEGKAILANYVNAKCYHTTFISNKDGVACQYVAYIQSEIDFLDEAKQASEMINYAIGTAYETLSEIKQEYSVDNKDKTIGFIRNNN